METNAGYTIISRCSITPELEVVLGEDNNGYGYVTWLCKNKTDYFRGHYFMSYCVTLKDYGERIASEAIEARR